MNNVIINRGQGGLGRQPLGQDFISGLVLYGALPSGFASSGTILKFGGISDAINAGINNLHSDETAAQITFTIGTEGSTGDNIQVAYVNPLGETTVLCNYVQVSGDSTTTLLATHLAAAINANTGISGFTATESTNTVVITVMPGQGAFPNTGTPLTAVVTNDGSSTFAYTQAVTTAGVGSAFDVWYYHINRFFTQSPNATLYVSVTTPPSWSGYGFPK